MAALQCIYIRKGPLVNVWTRANILELFASGKRWSPNRKNILLQAIKAGLVSREEVIALGITPHELDVEWVVSAKRVDVPAQASTQSSFSEPIPKQICIDGWCVGEKSKRSKAPDLPEKFVCVTPLQYKILVLLHRHRGEVVTSQSLYHGLYDGASRLPYIKIIDIVISLLRKRFRSAEANISIESLWGRGYKLLQSSATEPLGALPPASDPPNTL